MYKLDLALNNLPVLICHKPKQLIMLLLVAEVPVFVGETSSKVCKDNIFHVCIYLYINLIK